MEYLVPKNLTAGPTGILIHRKDASDANYLKTFSSACRHIRAAPSSPSIGATRPPLTPFPEQDRLFAKDPADDRAERRLGPGIPVTSGPQN